MLAGGSQTWITVGRLHHTSDTLSVQTVHNPLVRNERDITEDMDFEANSFLKPLVCLGYKIGRNELRPYSVAVFCLGIEANVGNWALYTVPTAFFSTSAC